MGANVEAYTSLDQAALWLIEWCREHGLGNDPHTVIDDIRDVLEGEAGQPEPPTELRAINGQTELIAEAMHRWEQPFEPNDRMVVFVGDVADISATMSGLVDLNAHQVLTTLVIPLIVRRALELEPNLADLFV